MTVTFHSLTAPPDRAEIDPILQAFYNAGLAMLAKMDVPPVDASLSIADYWTHAAEYLPPDGRTWIARDPTHRVVGFATMRRIRPDAGEMKRLFVRPDFRGQGIARRLVQARIDDARAMGLRHLLADTLRNNDEMQGLYQSLGFRFIAPFDESASTALMPELKAALVYMQLDL